MKWKEYFRNLIGKKESGDERKKEKIDEEKEIERSEIKSYK